MVSDWLTGLIPSLLRIQSLPRLNLSPTFIVPRTWPYLLFLLGIYGQPLKSHHQNSSLLFSLFQKVLWKHCSQYCLFILFKGCFPETVFLRLFSDNVCFDLDSGLLYSLLLKSWLFMFVIVYPYYAAPISLHSLNTS